MIGDISGSFLGMRRKFGKKLGHAFGEVGQVGGENLTFAGRTFVF